MTDEPTYWYKSSYRIGQEQLDDLLGKEQKLQAITDEWEKMGALGRARVASHAIDLANAIHKDPAKENPATSEVSIRDDLVVEENKT